MPPYPRRLRAAPLSVALVTAAFATPATAQNAGPSASPAIPAEAAAPTPSAQPSPRPPLASSADATVKNGYAVSRWAEDWTSKADAANRDDPLDRLKYLPLDEDGDIYLTLSGELRFRVNQITNPSLRETEAQRQDINRLYLGADLHIGRYFRAFGEIAHAGISGPNIGNPSTALRNDLVVQQSFVEASGDIEGVNVGVRYGRQEFADGSHLLLSQRDNNSIRYTLNGWRIWARGPSLRVGAFDFRPTHYGQDGTFDDVTDQMRRFSGGNIGVALPKTWLGGSNLTLDGFLWRRQNDVGAWGGRSGPADRYYLGSHLRGDIGRLHVDWLINRQWGQYIDQDISAAQAFIVQNYRLGDSKTAPRIGLNFDYASGGGGYGDGKLRNAYAPYGNSIYFSYQLALAASNLIAVTPHISFAPFKNTRLSAEYKSVWRDNVQDAIYRSSGQPYAGTENVTDRKTADLIRLQMVWNITPRVSLTGRYEHLKAGPALRKAGYSSSDFMAAWVSFRF